VSRSEQLQAWLSVFDPRHDSLSRKIFFNWTEKLLRYYEELGWELSDQELSSLVLRYFFPEPFFFFSPFRIPDFEKAVNILRNFYNSPDKRLVIYADRDADGISSSSILYSFFRDIMKIPEGRLGVLLPREEDKYGVTEEAAKRIIAESPDVLLTLDCGSSNRTELISTREALLSQGKSIEIIILDHHFIPAKPEDYPEVEAFVNPKRLPVQNTERELSTAGLAFHLIQGIVYSYTPDYQKDIVFRFPGGTALYRDGFLRENLAAGLNFRDILIERSGETISLQTYWDQTITQFPVAHRINSFLESFPEMANPGEIFHGIQQLHYRSVRDKTSLFSPLAAVGTIADLMPLTDNNRILVKTGLDFFRTQFQNIPVGLREIVNRLKIKPEFLSEQDISFSIAPLVNAAGRMGVSEEAFWGIVEKDPLAAAQKSLALQKLNEQRKALSGEGTDAILESLDPDHEKYPIAVAYDTRVHRGISGLVASRLAESLKKPVAVLVDDGDVLRGSVRSYKNEDIFSLLNLVKECFVQFGGHRQAAGFSLRYENRQSFTRKLYQASTALAEELAPSEKEEPITDEQILIEDSNVYPGLWQKITRFSPFGVLNPHPELSIRLSADAVLQPMGSGKHARVRIDSIQYREIECVWFFHGYDRDHIPAGSLLTVEPHKNYFAGRERLQLKIKKVDVPD